MKQLAEAFERRADTRVQGRIPCKLLIDGNSHPGIVRDFSIRGFFVESGVVLPIGASVVVAFDAAEDERFILEASVPHRRSAPRSLVDLVHDGIGLCVDEPPQAYRDWVAVSNRHGSRHAS
jgi:hypothetical protein